MEKVDFLLKGGVDETMTDNDCCTAADVLDHSVTLLPDYGHAEAQEQFEATLELLANAPADRKWRRQALLLLCRERHRRGEAKLLDDAAGDANDWTRVGTWVLEAGTGVGKEGIVRTIVGYL